MREGVIAIYRNRGGVYGSMILGWQTVAYVEQDEYCRQVIQQRINDGWFDNGEIHGDIKDFNEKHASKYAGQIDILTGGFPCQPFSVAGNRKGTSDDRWLFDEIIKTIKIIQPRRLFFENVPGILGDRAIIQIYQSLNKIGYRCKPPLLLGSDDCGNIHKRQRVWIYADRRDQQQSDVVTNTSDCGCSTGCNHWQERCIQENSERNIPQGQSERNEWQSRVDTDAGFHHTDHRCQRGHRRKSQAIHWQPALQRRKDIGGLTDLLSRPDVPTPLFRGMDDELPDWRKQLKAVGNGQDPIVMATAYNLLSGA